MRQISLTTDRELGGYTLDPAAQKSLDRLDSWRRIGGRFLLGMLVIAFVGGFVVSLYPVSAPHYVLQVYFGVWALLYAFLFLSAIFIPRPRCGTCNKRMKKKGVQEFKETAWFFTCDTCRTYADTGVKSGGG